jgi:type IV secretory pathway VirB3-like protein
MVRRFVDKWMRRDSHNNSNNNFGCCGFANAILLILGIVPLITGLILRKNIQVFDGIGGNTFNTIHQFSSILLVMGGCCVTISLIGICGSKCMNKCILIVYLIIIVPMFLFICISLLVVVSKSSAIETDYRQELKRMISTLDSNSSNFRTECDRVKAISVEFDCCGYSGPSDFNNTSLASMCCQTSVKYPTAGCAQKSVDKIESEIHHLFVLPSLVILAFEFPIMLCVTFLVAKQGAYQKI